MKDRKAIKLLRIGFVKICDAFRSERNHCSCMIWENEDVAYGDFVNVHTFLMKACFFSRVSTGVMTVTW